MGEALVLLNPIKRINIGEFQTHHENPSSGCQNDSRLSNHPLNPVGVISIKSKDILNEN
jgi:hypothetical protein